MFDYVKKLLYKTGVSGLHNLGVNDLIPVLYMLCNTSCYKTIHLVIIRAFDFLYYCLPKHTFYYLYYSLPRVNHFNYFKVKPKKERKEDVIIQELLTHCGISKRRANEYAPILYLLLDKKVLKKELGI